MTNPVIINPINCGSAPNDGLGDPIRTAFLKCNDNFANLNVFGNTIINGNSIVTIPAANGNVTIGIANVSNVAVFSRSGLTVANSFNTGTITTTGFLNVGANASIGGDLIVYGNITGPGNINVISGNSGQFFGNASTGFGALYAGLALGYANVPQTVFQTASQFNGYAQIENQNISNGNTATTDYVATAGNGNDITFFVDLGIASSSFDGAGFNVLGTSVLPNDSFLYAQGDLGNVVPGGNLVIGTNTPQRNVKIISGGSNAQNVVAYFNAPGTVSSSSNTGALVLVGGVGISGDINASTVTGNTITGILTTSAQPNITSVGTLTNLTLSGNLIGTTIQAATIGNAGTTITAFTINTNLLRGAQIGNANTIITGTLTTNAQPNITSVGNLTSLVVTGNLSAGNITGNLSGNSTTAITVSSNAQPNITSVGTLTSLDVNGNITTANGSFIGSGSGLTGTAANLTAGATQASLSFDTSGNGGSSGTTFNGSLPQTISYNTIGAAALTGVNATGNWAINTSGYAATVSSSAQPNITSVGNLVSLNVDGTLTANTINAGNINANITGTITNAQQVTGNAQGNITSVGTLISLNVTGNVSANNFVGTATQALYADLAENYLADADYTPGTVLSFGGEREVTMSICDMDILVAGVVSTDPAHLMNSGLSGDFKTPLALIGRVPCRVKGPVTRGAMMVSAGNGYARAEKNPVLGSVIGKALESFDGESGTIEIVVGKL